MDMSKPLLKEHSPELYQELHPTENENLDTAKFHIGYTRELAWLCPKNHTWYCSIARRVQNNATCYYCSNRKILPGYNDMLTLYPDVLTAFWDTTANGVIPNNLSLTQKFSAICKNQHTGWETTTHNLVIRKRGCPICSNKKIVQGINDLATTHPELAERVHSSSEYTAYEVSAGSEKKLRWTCLVDTQHVFEASPYRLTGKEERDCSICAGKTVSTGSNDFKTHYPEYAQQWDTQKNEISVDEISYGSSKKFWWIGSQCSHSFQRSPKFFAINQNCPYCSRTNATVLTGHNDLLTQYPLVAAEWSAKNTVSPDTVHAGSAKKYWWECQKNHEWEASISNRTVLGSGCPKCAMNGTSKGEQAVAEYVQSITENVITNSKEIIPPFELDIFIPEKNVAIEYNGIYWHSSLSPAKNADDRYLHYNKWKQCKQQGIQLITVWEDDWNTKQELVKNMLAHKIGVKQSRKVAARKTYVAIVTKEEAGQIYNHHHIQGHRDGFHIGLKTKSDDTLVAVSTWTRMPSVNEVRLDRFATSKIVQGGFSKLLKYAANLFTTEGFDCIVTFADHEVSDGALYENTGFTVDKEILSDYKYVFQGERKHKFGFRKKRFKNDPDLLYDAKLTEKELAELNKIGRVWDSGKTRYVFTL